MHWLQIVTGPLVGGVIGWFTNWLAVKMLFHPYKPVMFCGKQLPCTPGVIPRRKGDLAHAIGGAIETSLFGQDDIKQLLCGEAMQEAVASGVWSQLEAILTTDQSLRTQLDLLLGEGMSDTYREKAAVKLSAAASERLVEMDIGQMLIDIIREEIKKSVQRSMLGMFVTNDLINSLINPYAEKINRYVSSDGTELLEKVIRSESGRLLDTPVNALIHFREDTRERVCSRLKAVYAGYMGENAQKLAQGFEIGRVVEEKINAMDISEFETLVMSVMKNELKAIEYSGLALGLLIGVINIFI